MKECDMEDVYLGYVFFSNYNSTELADLTDFTDLNGLKYLNDLNGLKYLNDLNGLKYVNDLADSLTDKPALCEVAVIKKINPIDL
jgi:hypothetical protein